MDKPQTVNLQPGIYQVECWGSAGASNIYSTGSVKKGGNGSYTFGMIRIEKSTKFYVYVGRKGCALCSAFGGGGRELY